CKLRHRIDNSIHCQCQWLRPKQKQDARSQSKKPAIPIGQEFSRSSRQKAEAIQEAEERGDELKVAEFCQIYRPVLKTPLLWLSEQKRSSSLIGPSLNKRRMHSFRSSKSRRSRKKGGQQLRADDQRAVRHEDVRPWRALLLRIGLAALLAAAALLTVAVLLRGHRTPPPSLPPPPQQQLPHCIIIGARKCGTRALLDFLDAHPNVAAARSEIHYFDKTDRLRRGLSWYRGQMPHSRPGQFTIEKTPAYFVTEAAPRLARRQLGANLRLLLILARPRDPGAGRPARPLERLVLSGSGRVNPRSRMIQTSVYHRHLRRWLRHFPADRLHIVDGDRLIGEPHEELRLVEQFLSLPSFLNRPEQFVFNSTKGFYCVRGRRQRQRCLGSEKGRQHPPVSPVTLAKLRAYFEPHNLRLAELTGRRFAWMGRPEQLGAVAYKV
uniref:Sulfotransfer_1 domain-containing protein n=1 Tax=Macrostomum lignano TaxID=282301 RepID=A0A1I8F124_9PLAT